MSNNATTNSAKIRKLVVLAMLAAVIVVLQFVGGALHIGPFSLSLVLIPIVIGAALYGAVGGAVLGAVFGLMATIGCINGSDPGGAMVFAANPALCILVVMAKGTLAGAAAGWVYRLLEKKNSYLAMLCAAVVCPVVNTGVFLLAMFTVFVNVLQTWANGQNLVIYVLSGIVLINFVPELLINVLVSPASQRIINVVTRNKK